MKPTIAFLFSYLFIIFGFANYSQAIDNSEFWRLELKYNLKIGISAIRGLRTIKFKENDHFPYCSVFKWLVSADVLKFTQDSKLNLNQIVHYNRQSILIHSPITEKHLSKGFMSVEELSKAAISESDTTAANLLMSLIGKQIGLQKFVLSLGDNVTRFDRKEPDLNLNIPGDLRDTTTPNAMTCLLKKVIEGSVLSLGSKAKLIEWLKDSKTGDNRIRAGVPKGWSTGDKTGTGDHGATNDVGIIFPADGDPIYLSIFTTGDGSDLNSHEKAIAEATRLVVKNLK